MFPGSEERRGGVAILDRLVFDEAVVEDSCDDDEEGEEGELDEETADDDAFA
jgi:hypothetical protein